MCLGGVKAIAYNGFGVAKSCLPGVYVRCGKREAHCSYGERLVLLM